MVKKEKQASSIKEVRKNDIVLSALKVFCEKGYSSATINDIVKKAKCSHGLFYHYFKNKKAIFDAVMELRGKSMMDFLDEVLVNQENYLSKLKTMTEYAFSNTKNDELFAYRYYFFVSTIFAKAESGELPPKCNTPPPHVRMHEFFREGIKRGDFNDRHTPESCAKLYNCIIQGATLNFILCPKEYKRSFDFPDVDFILELFKGDKNG